MNVFKGVVSIVLIVLLLASSWGGTVVCTNLSDDGVDVLCDAAGAPLPLGCYAAIGHFGLLTSPEIEQKISQEGIPGWMAIWEGFGEAFAIGRGSGHAGCFEVEQREVLGPRVGGDLHVAVMNGPSPEASTSLILLAFEGTTAPGETAGGLAETQFLHLRDASIVMGFRDGERSGVQSLPVASTGFAAWVHDHLGAGEPLSLALDADADGDWVCNLAEYALLGDPTEAADDVRLNFVATEAGLKGRFPALADDPLVTYRVEMCEDLSDEDWSEYDGALEVHSESDLPSGYLECRVPLPDMDRHFLRVRVAYTGGAGG